MVNYLDWLTPSNENKVRLFYYTSSNHVLDNLTKGRLKISNFSKCNDLFELASFDLRDRSVRKKHRDWVQSSSEKCGLICLTNDWRSQLMWGHYSGSGSGLCLVLELPKGVCFPVEYVSQRKIVSEDFRFPDPGEWKEFGKVCAIKSNDWSYEKEQRLLIDLERNPAVKKESDMNFLQFGDGLDLIGVINGPKPDIGSKKIEQACASLAKGISYFQCRASFRDFRMVVQQDKRLWKLE